MTFTASGRDVSRACLLLLALLLLLPAPAAHAQQTSAQYYLESLKGNVVRVEAGGQVGFGFIVGIEPRKLLIATAEHTVDGTGPPRVCFLDRTPPCPTGSVVYRDDPVLGQADLDLAFIEVEYPEGLVWRPDVMAAEPRPNDPAWFIGRELEWYIPTAAGSIVERQDTGTVTYRGLSVAQGVSGAPIITAAGIVAMHVKSEGGDGPARGVALGAIRNRLEERLRRRWVLVPQAECAGQDVHRRVLAGRTVVVHFDGNRPAAALDAMARLHCLGAWPLPRPVWSASEWQEGILYRSGDLRTARTLQTVLAPVGRLDTRLGEPESDAELWIR